MKKILLTLFVALSALAVSAKSVTINAAALPVTQDGIKVEGTATFGTAWKVVKNQVLTISATQEGSTITSIKVAGSNTNLLTAEGYSTDTWTGSAASVTLTGTGSSLKAANVTSLTVVFTEAGSGKGTFDDLYVPFKYDGVNYNEIKPEWESPVIDQENGKSEVTFSTANIEFKALGGTTPKNVEVADESTPFPGWTAGWNDVTWNRKNQNLDDAKTKFFTYIAGTGNPVIETNYEYSSGNSGNFYRPTYIYYGPYSADTLTTVGDKQYIRKMPTQGLYYQFTAKKDGKLKIAAFVNKGNRFTFVIDKATLEPVSFTCEGYINGQNEVNPDDPNGKNRKKWLTNDEIQKIHNLSGLCERDTVFAADSTIISINVKKDNYPYTIGDGNQHFWGYLNMSLKAGQTYLMFHDSSQIGFGGFEFTDGTPAEGDLFSATATVYNTENKVNVETPITAGQTQTMGSIDITTGSDGSVTPDGNGNVVLAGNVTFAPNAESTTGNTITKVVIDLYQETPAEAKAYAAIPEGGKAVGSDGWYLKNHQLIWEDEAGTSSVTIPTLAEVQVADPSVTEIKASAITVTTQKTVTGIRGIYANGTANSSVAPRKHIENGQILIGNYNIAGQRVK